MAKNWWENDAVVEAPNEKWWEQDAVVSQPQGRRDVTPFKVDVQQPRPAPVRQAAAPQQVSADYSPSGDDFGSAIMAAAAPTNPNAPGLISRIGSFLKPEPKSVLENYQPSPQERQAEIDKRLAAGAGPISKQTMATADLVRSTRGTSQAVASKDATVNRVVQLLDEKKAPAELANLFERANDPAVALGAQQQKANEFRTAGEWAADTFSGLGQGVTSLVQLPTNLIAPGSNLGGILRDTQKELQAQESDVLKAQRAELSARVKNEDGFLGKYFTTVESLVTNPALGLSEAVKQVPNFLAVLRLAQLGGAVAGGSVAAASRVSPTVALSEAISGGAIQAGARTAGTFAGGFTANAVMTSGDAAGNVYETLTDPKKTPTSNWEQNPDYQKLLVENLVKRGRTEEQARGEIAKVRELSKDLDAMGDLKNLPGYKDYKLAQKEAIDEIATSKARLAGLIVLPLAAFGFMGAEATLVARGAGRGLAEAATPKGAAKVFAKEFFGEQIEEGGTQAGGNILIQTVNPKQALLEGVPEAMGTAAVTSAPFSAAAVGQQVRDALNRPAPAVDLAADAYARRALDVQSYDANIIRPDQTAKVQRDQTNLQQSTTADAAAAAADSLSGSLNELLVPSTAITPLPLEPTFRVGEMTPSVGRAGPGFDASALTPSGRLIEPGLDLSIPATAGQVVEPTLDLNAPAAEINQATEQQFGLDKLRINAPRPQSIQGTPVADLTDDQLQVITGDETVAPISRRSAAIELTARQDEAGAFTQRAAPQATGAPSTVSYAGETLDTSRTSFGLGDAQGRVSDAPVTGAGATARAELQARLDRAAAIHGVAVPTLTAPTPENEAAVSIVADALGGVGLVNKVVAYSDPDGADGFELGGVIAVNTESQKGIAHTSWHEGFHIAERIAAADTAAGRTDTPAQQYVASIHGLFGEMSDEGKRAYISNFLNKEELDSIQDPVAREARITEMLTEPKTRSEMTADFMGNRATDKRFLASLAKADPKGFGDFVKKWIGILDGMIARLRGVRARSNLESVKVDSYLKDLNRAKMVARDALVAYRNGTLQQLAPTTTPPAMSLRQGEINAPTIGTRGSENLPGPTAQDRPGFSEDGGGPTPTYGTARTGAISVVARHYSTTPRQTLSGAYYGQGLKGAERTRLDSSTDPRLKNRVYFYVDQGAGIRPESGVGGYAHETKLDNIYDPQTRLIKPQADANAFESAVINAGFDGYIAPFGNGQSAVVLLGQKHKAVPVKQIGQPRAAALPAEAAPTTLKKGLLTREASQVDTGNIPGSRMRMGTLEIPAGQVEAANTEMTRIGSEIRFAKRQAAPARVMFEVAPDPNNLDLNTRWDAVPFERKIEISQRVAAKIMPQVFRLAGVRAKMTTQLGGYLEKTSPSFAAILPSTASAEQLMDVARLGGFGLTQEEMMVLDSKPFEGSSLTGLITITLPENMQDQESVHSVYQAIRQVSPENIKGHTTVGKEMVLAVPSDRMADLVSKIQGALGRRPEGFIINAAEGQSAFVSNKEYDYDSENGNLTPELLAKRTEARRIREEASAAIEAELAADESSDGRKINTGVYRAVAEAFNLTQVEYDATALPLMLGGTGNKTFRAPKIGGIPEVVQWLTNRRLESGLPILNLNKAQDRTTLAKLMASEAVAAIRSAGNAVEWYDETVEKMLRIMAVKYPELNTDPNARNAFLIAVAISSQTMDVEANLTFASSQYEAYRTTGKFPEIGQGKSIPAMTKNFALANRVMADMGPDLLRRFLQTEFTKRELETVGFPIGGESMDEKILGSAIFGPKIGFGFYSNLTGNFEPITMDMWFMRLVGRLTGTLPAFDPVLFPKQVAKLRAALAETGPAEIGVYAAQFDPAAVQAAMETDEGAIALARQVSSLHNRQFIKQREAFDSGTRIKTPLVGAAGAILKSADKPTDAPSSGGERQRLRDVTRQMVAMVEQQIGKRVPPAALQALVWYPEQELYKKLGVDLAVTSQDYAGAAKLLLTKEGFDGKQIDTAAQSGPGPARQVAGKQNARADGQTGQPTRPTGPLQGAERESFIQARTSLEDVFAGLDKRGLAKTNMESIVARRTDAAQIKYVQENFNDILIQLEDADKVKINCK